MKKVFVAVLFLSISLFGATSYAGAQEVGPLEGISMEKAKHIALKQVKGKIIAAKIEKDDGITKYEIIVKTKEGRYEVEIDKATGKVLEVEKEGFRSDNGKHEDHEDND